MGIVLAICRCNDRNVARLSPKSPSWRLTPLFFGSVLYLKKAEDNTMDEDFNFSTNKALDVQIPDNISNWSEDEEEGLDRGTPKPWPKLQRHPQLSFDDGNLVIVPASPVARTTIGEDGRRPETRYYFLVHGGVIARHSAILKVAIENLAHDSASMSTYDTIEGQAVLEVTDTEDDLLVFLSTFYESPLLQPTAATAPSPASSSQIQARNTTPVETFNTTSALLRLGTKYGVISLQVSSLGLLRSFFPRTLNAWDTREAEYVNSLTGIYTPRSKTPHPALVIGLVRELASLSAISDDSTSTAVNAQVLELLPSLFYDLSRLPPSIITSLPQTLISDADVLWILKGREHASRFLSTFIVNELEGREPSAGCLYRNGGSGTAGNGGHGGAGNGAGGIGGGGFHQLQGHAPHRRSACAHMFEAMTYELLKDVNSQSLHVQSHQHLQTSTTPSCALQSQYLLLSGETYANESDPLYTILDSDVGLPAVRRIGMAGSRVTRALVAGLPQTSGGGAGVLSGPGGFGGVMMPAAHQTAQQGPAQIPHLQRACEVCRGEYSTAVDAAREDFWQKIPGWFGMRVPANWG